MSLPTSRNTTYALKSQVKSTDLNDLQDAVVGRRFPRHWRWFLPEAYGDSGDVSYLGSATAGSDTSYVENVIKGLSPGDVIYALKVRFKGSAAAGTGHARIQEVIDGVPLTRADLQLVDPPFAWATYSLILPTPYVVLDEAGYFFSMTFGKSGREFNSWAIEVGRLAT